MTSETRRGWHTLGWALGTVAGAVGVVALAAAFGVSVVFMAMLVVWALAEEGWA
jgi:hypothetical protein